LYSTRSQSPAGSLLCVFIFPFPYSVSNFRSSPAVFASHSMPSHTMFLCWWHSASVPRTAITLHRDRAFFFDYEYRVRICIIRRQNSTVGVYPFSRLLTRPLYSVPAVARASPACKWSVCLRVAGCCCRIGRCFRAARSCPSSCLNAGRRVFRETRVDPRRPTRPTCRQFCTRSARSNLIRLATAHFLTRPHPALSSLKWRLLPNVPLWILVCHSRAHLLVRS